MVLNVDSWVETNEVIGLVTDISEVRRTGGRVVIYVPGEEEPRVVDVEEITGEFC